IDACIKSQFLNDVIALHCSTGDADCAAALQFGKLSDDAADGTGCSGYDDRLARFRLAMLVQANPGGGAWHSRHPEITGQRNELGVDLQERVAGRPRILLPTELAEDEVAAR